MMKSMLPLRAAALASNVFFVAYGCVESLLPIVILHGVLLPLNAARQNPKLGFHLIRLIVGRLLRDATAGKAESPSAVQAGA